MRKSWLVAAATYRRSVRSGMFLILTFGLPVLMIIAGAVPILRELRVEAGVRKIGVVDLTGELSPIDHISTSELTIELTRYPSEAEAELAYRNGDIEGFMVVPADYFSNPSATYRGEEEPTSQIETGLVLFLRQSMAEDLPSWAVARLSDPSRASLIATETGEEIEQGAAVVSRVVTPVLLYLAFALAVFTGVSQIGGAVVREKDQRAMEMIITSLSPGQLVAGKVLGMTLVSLTQLAVWGIGGAAAAGLALSGTLHLSSLSIPWGAVGWAVLLGVPGYFLYAMTAAGLGIIAGDQQQAQQLAGMLGFLEMVPLWLLGAILDSPNGALSVALTLFPFTAPMFGLIRMTVTSVPAWQLAIGLAMILAAFAACTWIVARIFRAAMLMYGQALRPRQVLRALSHA